MVDNYTFRNTEKHPSECIKHWQENNAFFFESKNGAVCKIAFISDEIIRFRYNTTGYFENDFSYAIDISKQKNIPTRFIEKENKFIIEGIKLNCYIEKGDLKISIYNKKGKLVCGEEKGFHWEENEKHGGDIVKMSKCSYKGEMIYGLGDKPMHLNLKGKKLELWGTDAFAYEENQDPLYKNIPFYYSLYKNQAYGIFFDNTFKSTFNFAQERFYATTFEAEGGEMNYYFIYGPELINVCEKYTLLTGTPEMPPLWSLGFQQCKWSYHPENEVRDITNRMRELKIPCDAIYLDIDYMDGFRCFTWDNEKFPQPKKLISDLKKKGFKTVVIIDPGIKVDRNYSVFNDGVEKEVFCRRADGAFYKGKVWPGECYFPDFTKEKVREWWADLYQELVEETGVDGVWNDMNEPAIFEQESKTMPNDVRFDYDGHPCSHRKAHNVYGMQMARATYEGVKKYSGERRPLIITRSGYSGMQRYSSVWTGDNIATWRHLWLANIQCQRLSISGISFAGSDVGGFVEHPTKELFTRWVQLGVFHPFFRVHSSGDHGNQEPWSFGEEATNLVREAIELRYQLLPNIYTAFYQYHKFGTPMLRPLSFYDQSDENNLFRTDEFMMGDNILVVPILEPNSLGREIYLPKGKWYNYHTNELLEGKKEYFISVEKNQIPIFIKAGAVIPHFPVMQYTGEKKIEMVRLNIYLSEEETTSYFYHDEGNNESYKNDNYCLTKFTLKNNLLSQEIEGNLDVNFNYELYIITHDREIIKKSANVHFEKITLF